MGTDLGELLAGAVSVPAHAGGQGAAASGAVGRQRREGDGDPAFFESLPFLYPQADARSWFAGNADLAQATAARNGTLQGAYLIVAARAVGLDCGPMSGFDNELVDREFFAAEGWRSNFLVCLGHGDPADMPPRAPRLEFDAACRLL